VNDLLDYLTRAVDGDAIPRPIDGESMDVYRLRAAHAGAIVGIKWITDRNTALAAEDAAAAAQGAEPDVVVDPE
jgi:hypothetical protein